MDGLWWTRWWMQHYLYKCHKTKRHGPHTRVPSLGYNSRERGHTLGHDRTHRNSLLRCFVFDGNCRSLKYIRRHFVRMDRDTNRVLESRKDHPIRCHNKRHRLHKPPLDKNGSWHIPQYPVWPLDIDRPDIDCWQELQWDC